MRKVIRNTIIFTIIVTTILNFIPNKSNFPKKYVIPIITASLVKYIIGDWDKGYQWTYIDYLYWTTIISISFIVTLKLAK
jgi:hypothetical protein